MTSAADPGTEDEEERGGRSISPSDNKLSEKNGSSSRSLQHTHTHAHTSLLQCPESECHIL